MITWSHSVTTEADFVPPFAAQMMGVIRAFNQILRSQLLPEVGDWPEGRTLFIEDASCHPARPAPTDRLDGLKGNHAARSRTDMDSSSAIEPLRDATVQTITEICFGRPIWGNSDSLEALYSVQPGCGVASVQLAGKQPRRVTFDHQLVPKLHKFPHSQACLPRKGILRSCISFESVQGGCCRSLRSKTTLHTDAREDVQGGSCRPLRPDMPRQHATCHRSKEVLGHSGLSQCAGSLCGAPHDLVPGVQGGSCRPLHPGKPSQPAAIPFAKEVQGGSCRPLPPPTAWVQQHETSPHVRLHSFGHLEAAELIPDTVRTIRQSAHQEALHSGPPSMQLPPTRFSRNRRVEYSATAGTNPPAGLEENGQIIDDSEVAPFSRPVVSTAAGSSSRHFFTSFGTVEGHMVLQKQPHWSEQQCVQEAIAHAAPALMRPNGRPILRPLPGLFEPQIVLTRLPLHSPFRTVVFDLRGADLRTEDIRINVAVADIFQGEGPLAPMSRILQLDVQTVTFSVNLFPPSPSATVTGVTDTVTVHPRPVAPDFVGDRASTCPSTTCGHTAVSSSTNVSRATYAAAGTRWSSGSSWDRGVYRPSRPPTPPIPEEAADVVRQTDQAMQAGATFTVFDTHFHKRTLIRHPGLTVPELVELAVSLTPQLRRPWGFRVLDLIWEDLATPQIVIWGPIPDHRKVVPIRDQDSPDQFCTVLTPTDASPLQVLIEAGNVCPAFARARIQVARLERVFQADHVSVPPFEAGAVSAAQVASIRTTFGPTLPLRRRGTRWQPETPTELQVLSPADIEDLWPVSEVVVHFIGSAPRRMDVPFGTEAHVVLSNVMRTCGVTRNCALRLPTYCPAEPGAPLHLFAYQYDAFDPWNDPPAVGQQSWALLDLRRVVQPPRPQYLMLALPRVFDLSWIREAVAISMPELPYVAAAYMGPDMLVEHCSPKGNTPLITGYPDMHFVFEPGTLVDTVLDTHALSDRRPGFRLMQRTDRAQERQFTLPPRTARAAVNATSDVRALGFPAGFPILLSAVVDEEAREHSSEEVLVFCPGETPRPARIARALPPGPFLCEAAAAFGLQGECTLQVPTLGPLVPGHIPSVAVIPMGPHASRFLLVDARRVMDASTVHLWLQEAPAIINPVILIAMLRRVQPALREIGAFYLDCKPVYGYAELSSRVTLMTLVPSAADSYALPSPLCNGRAFRTRIGFMQLDCRVRPQHRRRRSPGTTTSTTQAIAASSLGTTTTTTRPDDAALGATSSARGAQAFRFQDCLLRVFVTGADRQVSCITLRPGTSLTAVMTQLCTLLWEEGSLRPDQTFRACDRAFNDHDVGFSVYICSHLPTECHTAWVDALPYGCAPYPVALPLRLTHESIIGLSGAVMPAMVHVAINGNPWDGEPRDILHCDVITFRPSHSALFSIPLSALEDRIFCISSLMWPRRGPSGGISVERWAQRHRPAALCGRRFHCCQH